MVGSQLPQIPHLASQEQKTVGGICGKKLTCNVNLVTLAFQKKENRLLQTNSSREGVHCPQISTAGCAPAGRFKKWNTQRR